MPYLTQAIIIMCVFCNRMGHHRSSMDENLSVFLCMHHHVSVKCRKAAVTNAANYSYLSKNCAAFYATHCVTPFERLEHLFRKKKTIHIEFILQISRHGLCKTLMKGFCLNFDLCKKCNTEMYCRTYASDDDE